MNGLITISRIGNPKAADHVRIRLVDQLGRDMTLCVDISMAIAEFGDAILGHGMRPCTIDLHTQEPA